MSAQPRDELREFQRFLSQKVDSGGTALSPEEVLDEWRTLHPGPESLEDAAAIQEALDDLEKGDSGVPFDEFDRGFRERRKLPPRA